MQSTASRQRFAQLVVTLAGPLLVGGCGDDTTIAVNEFTPMQLVEGTVTDGITGEPLEDVEVGGLYDDAPTAETNGDGYYEVMFEEWGVRTIHFEANGYARARAVVGTSAVPAAGGDFLIRFVRDAVLYPTNANLTGLVTSGGPRNVLEGATVMVGFGEDIDDPSLMLETTTGEDGRFEFEDLPAGVSNTSILVMAHDIDGDGVPDTENHRQFVGGSSSRLAPGLTSEIFVEVNPFTNDRVVWTNVDDSALVPSDTEFVFVFARPMQPDSLTRSDVFLTHNSGRHEVSVSWDSNDTELTVNPSGDLEAGDSYTLSFTATSVAGQDVHYAAFFRVEGGDALDEVTGLALVTDPVPFDLSLFELSWDTLPGANAYRVFARNGTTQRTWTQIASLQAQATERGLYQLSLPRGQFNTISEPFYSPFANGTEVEIAVAGLSGNVQGSFSDAIVIADTECPTLIVSQVASAASGVERTIEFRISSTAGEPLDAASTASIDFTEGGIGLAGDDQFALDGGDFELRVLSQTILALTGTIGESDNGTEDLFEVDLSGIRDIAGNAAGDEDACPLSFSGVTY